MNEEKWLTEEEILDLLDGVRKVLPQGYCQRMDELPQELLDQGHEPKLRDYTHELLLLLAAVAKVNWPGSSLLVDDRALFDEMVCNVKVIYYQADDRADDWIAECFNMYS